MAFADIRVGASVVFENPADYEDDTVTITLNSVPAGAAIVVLGGCVRNDFSANTTLSSASSSIDGALTVSNQTPGAVAGNSFAAYRANCSAGNHTITLTLSQGSGGTKVNRISGVAFVVLDAVTTSLLDNGGNPVKATTTATSSTCSTGASSTLSQTDCLVMGVACGAFGNPSNPTGYTEYLSRTNGNPYIGTQVSVKKVTATTAVTFEVTHESTSNQRTALALILKAKTAASYSYEFPFDPAELNDTHTGLTVDVWRNGDSNAIVAERYTGQAGSADGVLRITGVPGAAAPGQSLKCVVMGTNIGSVGYVDGSVV